ncbi:hypothetical protein BWD42_07030 [Sphingobacterium sp. CZ-UAM]|uniref:hypothetical protein n=1 Tax=Sphingobacterium sp. CZ-UAM TaxID=1933868 RepID=UPI0009844610|nr:hypothetical protein [Sphingobacterium sp. CZ-UAM]OOG19659.1 hypothetical protein BWD42_07030 [Sphingobacterium sp. CZ-UAM]
MKIELKTIQHSPQLSEETHAFTANLHINGKHAGYAKNNGRGGATYYLPKDQEGKVLIREAEKYCEGLPPSDHTKNNSLGGLSHDMDLEQYIDDLLNKHIEKKEIAKFNAKMNKVMLKGIVYGIPDKSYSGFVYIMPMIKLLAHPNGPEIVLRDLTEKVLPSLKQGQKLLNTNIPESIIKAAGFREGQYVTPTVRNIRYGTIPYIEDDKNNRGRSR